jgi:hypothetical protein
MLLPKFTATTNICGQISHNDQNSSHQFILSPVSGEGRVSNVLAVMGHGLTEFLEIVVNHKIDDKTPQFDVHLHFEEIGVALDDNQYRDVISLVDMYHFYTRQHQVSSNVGATSQTIEVSSTANSDQVMKSWRETALELVCDSLVQPF